MGVKDRFKALEERKPIVETVAEKKGVSETAKRKRALVTFALDPNDVEQFNALQVKLSARDGVIYKKQELQVACVKQFLEIARNNIDKIKIERF